MDKNRIVHKQMSIFDIYNDLDHSGRKTIRVMYEYNGIDNTKAFRVLNRDISQQTAANIIAWLEQIVTAEDPIYGLDVNAIDPDMNERSIN